MYLYAFLWQQWLFVTCREAIEFCEDSNIRLQPTGLRARLIAEGSVDDQDIHILWSGGIFGGSSSISINGSTQKLALLDTKDAVTQILVQF